MTITKNEFQNTITFLKAYRAMEMGTLAANHKLIKKVVDKDKAKHLCESWSGRDNNFGSFFLNVSYKTQGQFLIHWGIDIPEYNSFVKELQASPAAHVFANPPIEILNIHALMVYFNNHGIGDDPKIIFPMLPTNRYGNSTNWGSYILTLTSDQQLDLLSQISILSIETIQGINDNREFLRKANSYSYTA